MRRREFLTGLAALAASPAWADRLSLGASTPFDLAELIAQTKALAEAAYKPMPAVPDAWQTLSYDEYRKIWFDPRNAVWEGTDVPLRLDVFPAGLYFPRPVDVHVVKDNVAQRVPFEIEAFDRTDDFPDLPTAGMGYSGLRLRGPLERADIHTEFAVFQGASYFRAIGTGQIYGLSARGLAIDTAEPSGEEFPDFRAFWVQAPEPGQNTTLVHAQMDSPSVAGLYTFEITPGETLHMGVTARLFPRQEMQHVGIAPLTSMFQFDETNRDRFSDFRPAVHDSDGLLMLNGAGETIWRPLANPKALQVSGFQDNNPRGFGLMQRADRFSDFHDLEALYHRRPGLWVKPREDWGRGHVALVEIPTDREIYDNIVAYWRPATPLQPGDAPVFSYDLYWGPETTPGVPDLPKVLNTRAGKGFERGIVFAIDFEADARFPEDFGTIDRIVRSSAGEVTQGVVQRNPDTGGPRLAFTFEPGDATVAEFRVQLRSGTEPLSETWLYRWTK
ncbi:glucan biosynthesis protein [Shimia marina]|uniref:Glucans biosynthesis protein G n=1 Tax=Shimia marina TaxID=321267 RepID=A0A0P1EPW4_9RHOB|nr:glucan biosynthesis protein G [Shimia marina]CUH52121.1 Glucans biosynthesis protein G precursor [Shimia marina]SFE64419.1 glucans biosynthesis protein [Shimia marina]